MMLYMETALWKAADKLRHEVDTMTCGFAEYHTLIRLLQEKTEALPAATAAICASASPDPRAIKRAYELAHDAEYVLFSAQLFRSLPYEATATLYEQLYEVKRLVAAAEFKDAYGRD